MDALPLALNRHQLELLHDSLATDDGNGESERADDRIARLEECLQSELASWDNSSEEDKVVSLPLDTYQLDALRSGIQHKLETIDAGEKEQLEKVLEQLPEYSPQENAD